MGFKLEKPDADERGVWKPRAGQDYQVRFFGDAHRSHFHATSGYLSTEIIESPEYSKMARKVRRAYSRNQLIDLLSSLRDDGVYHVGPIPSLIANIINDLPLHPQFEVRNSFRVLLSSLDDVPLHLGSRSHVVRSVAAWRLENGT